MKSVTLYQSSGVGVGFDFASREEADEFAAKVREIAPRTRITTYGTTTDVWFYPRTRTFTELICEMESVRKLIKLSSQEAALLKE